MIGRLVMAGCLVACSSPSPSASFTIVDQNETGSLLSAWGSSASDVWVVGGRPSLDAGPTVLHFDGGAWTRVDSGQTTIDLWWVFGVGGDVFFSGSRGTILRYRAGAFEALATPSTDGVVFGMWGPSAQDLWAVGRVMSTAGMLMWHFDGTTWTAVDLPAGFPPGLLGFKVSGQRTDDVWFSCSGGMTLHWDGAALAAVPTGDTASLFSIVSTPTTVLTAGAVGTTGGGALDENTGGGWQSAALNVPEAWRGLAASPTGEIYVVGADASIAVRDPAGTWTQLDSPAIQHSFHADWVDPDGGLWGVGGDFDHTPLTANGFLVYRGTAHVPAVE